MIENETIPTQEAEVQEAEAQKAGTQGAEAQGDFTDEHNNNDEDDDEPLWNFAKQQLICTSTLHAFVLLLPSANLTKLVSMMALSTGKLTKSVKDKGKK